MAVSSILNKITGKKETKKKTSTKRATPKKIVAASIVSGQLTAKYIDLQPMLTEKGVGVQGTNQAIFKVSPTATKGQIEQAVMQVYGVKPVKIRTMQVRGKWRRRGAVLGRTPAWKKAYVTVQDIKALNLTA